MRREWLDLDERGNHLHDHERNVPKSGDGGSKGQHLL